MTKKISRRNFIKGAAVGMVVMKATPSIARTYEANEKLNIAFIGVGGMGLTNYKDLRREHPVAVCDVDLERAGDAYNDFETSRQFTDFRRMFDAMHQSIDAVVVSTPDHSHFHPAYTAMELDKHVYLEKPLAHNVWETRVLTRLARRKGLVTQLGAQRHANPNMHRVVELIKTGAIGDVTEVYSWVDSDRGMAPPRAEETPVPSTLDYQQWLGPARDFPYDPAITPYGWRFIWDFGTGETGNWGCHILDIPFWALDLDYPSHVSAVGEAPHPVMTPKDFKSTLEFPAKGGRPAVKLHWRQQKGGPEILRELRLPSSGNNLFIGTQGMLLCDFKNHRLYPRDKFEDFEPPKPFIPASPGFRQEFVYACKGDDTPPTCNFDYTGPMAEAVLLANTAFRAGVAFDWDHETMTCKGAPQAQALIQSEYRTGWEVTPPRDLMGSLA